MEKAFGRDPTRVLAINYWSPDDIRRDRLITLMEAACRDHRGMCLTFSTTLGQQEQG